MDALDPQQIVKLVLPDTSIILLLVNAHNATLHAKNAQLPPQIVKIATLASTYTMMEHQEDAIPIVHSICMLILAPRNASHVILHAVIVTPVAQTIV